MHRFFAGLFIFVVCIPTAFAGATGLDGNWKVSILEDGTTQTFWILSIKSKDGKLTGSVAKMSNIAPSKLERIEIKGDRLEFDIDIRGRVLSFEAKLPRPGSKKILGSVLLGPQTIPVSLVATTATNEFEMQKELVTRTPTDPRVFSSVISIINQAGEHKIMPKEVEQWASIGLRAAEMYGPRMQSYMAVRLAKALMNDEKYYPAAVAIAEKAQAFAAEQKLYDKQLEFLEMMNRALTKLGKKDELGKIQAKIAVLEDKAYHQHEKTALPFKTEKFKGRKAKSTRRVLVELFTGAQCPPCVAADMAFDAIEDSFSTDEVVLLQYHLHIPRPDALTNGDAEARQLFYGDKIEGTPTMFFNGKLTPPPGGLADNAPLVYQALRKTLEPLLEKPATVNIALKAALSDGKIDITGDVKSDKKLGPKTKLRFALVEEWVRYRGSNGLPYHHRVVREMPGGAKGFDLSKTTTHKATVDLSALRKKLTGYLDKFAKDIAPFPDDQRPMRLQNLRIAAFVQDDATGEVLQATDVGVKK